MSAQIVKVECLERPLRFADRNGKGVGRRAEGWGVGAGRDEVTARKWQRLAKWWAVYYCVVFTVGRFEEYNRVTIWFGGSLLGLLTLRLLIRRMSDVPSEAWLLAALAGWSLISGLGAEDGEAYFSNLTLLLECLFVVALLGAVVRKSGNPRYMWWAFLGVAVFNTWYVVNSGVEVSLTALGEIERQKGLTGNPNALGFFCFVGLLGAMAIFGGTKSLSARLLCVAGSVVALGGMLMAGSRGAYLAWVLSGLLWATTCLPGGRRRVWKIALGGVIGGVCLYVAVGWIQENTGLGLRMSGALTREDASSEDRLQLALIGAKLALEHPLTGVGLGQFAIKSGTGVSAHNEWAEFAATTGFPGFLLVQGVYLSIWRRLSHVVAQGRSQVELYEARMARVALIALVVAGAVFRPNILSIDTMFLLALVAGTGSWSVARR